MSNFLALQELTAADLNSNFGLAVTRISGQTLGSAASSVTFLSIPNTYSALRLVALARSSNASAGVEMRMQFNSDTTSIYDTQQLAGQGATAVAAEHLAQNHIKLGDMAAASATANHCGIFEVTIPFYAGTAFIKLVHGHNNQSFGTATGNLLVWPRSGRWRSTAAINSITLFPSAGSFITGSSFALYGLP